MADARNAEYDDLLREDCAFAPRPFRATALGDTTTLADPSVVAKLKANYEDRE